MQINNFEEFKTVLLEMVGGTEHLAKALAIAEYVAKLEERAKKDKTTIVFPDGVRTAGPKEPWQGERFKPMCSTKE